MIRLQTIKISKSFGIETILSDINIQIHSNERVGLVGLNGTGKSTLVKILVSELTPDSGDIQIAKGTKIGYLAQNSILDTEKTIWDEMKSIYSDLIDKEKKIRELEQKISNPSYINNNQKYEKVINDYSRLTNEFKDEGGYMYEAKIRGVLHGLNFASIDYYKQHIHTLSGGQKTRLAIAKLLLEEPELLILDEPTNYLDIDTLSWLEFYLKSYLGAILVISHDRYFLDSLIDTIYEIENTTATKYSGNYSRYIEQKTFEIEQQLKLYTKQQNEIKKLEEFVQKNIARASTTRRAQSRKKVLEKIEKLEKTKHTKSVSFSFDSELKSGNNVLLIKDLSMAFNKNLLFNNLSFNISKGERVALIGPNGIGKSTLLKLINGILTPTSGTVRLGSNVFIGYYDQEQNELDMENSIIDELWNEHSYMSEKEIRTLLGNFLFINEDVFKKVKHLSGGEKARVSLAKLMLKKANLLLLDEPTNHLDTYSREVLENALIEYSGTILYVSHDRYFLNRVSTRTIELTQSGVINYLGNYDYYIEKKKEIEENKAETTISKVMKINEKSAYIKDRDQKNQQRSLNRKLDSIEKEIELLEKKITDIETELTTEEIFSNHHLTNQKNKELLQARADLEILLKEWESIQIELES